MGFTRCKKGVAAIQNICTNIKKESQKALNLKHIFVKKVFTPDRKQIMFEFRHTYVPDHFKKGWRALCLDARVAQLAQLLVVRLWVVAK